MYPSDRRTARGFRRTIASAGIMRGASLVIRALIGLVFARLLGAAEVGELFLALALSGLVALFARRGLDRLALSEVANHPEDSQIITWHRLAEVIRLSAVAVLLGGVGAIVVGAAIGGMGTTLIWAVVAILPLNVSQVVAHVLRGEHRVVSSILVGATLGPVLRLVVFFVLPGAETAERAAAAFAIGWTLTSAVGLLLVRPRQGSPDTEWNDRRTGDARSLHLLALNEQFRDAFSTALMWFVGIPAEVGALGTAQRLDQATFLPTSATRFATGPAFAAANRDIYGARHLAIRTARKSLLLQVPMSAAAWFAAPQLLGLLGDGFDSGTNWLRLLLLVGLVNSASGSTTQFLLMSPSRSQLARSSGLGTGVLLCSSAVFVPLLGSSGIVLALALASVSREATEWWMVRSLLGGRIDIAASPHPGDQSHS